MLAWHPVPTIESVLSELRLNAIEDFFNNDRLVLALIGVRLVHDLYTVGWVGQQRLQTAFIKLSPAFRELHVLRVTFILSSALSGRATITGTVLQPLAFTQF